MKFKNHNSVIPTFLFIVLLLTGLSLWSASAFAVTSVCGSAEYDAIKNQNYIIWGKSYGLSNGCQPLVRYNVKQISVTAGRSESVVCDGSRIPPGYVTTNNYEDTTNIKNCAFSQFSTGYYSAIKVPSSFSTREEVCSGSYIPSGWVITSILSDTTTKRCSGSGGTFRWVIEKPTRATYTVCDSSSSPTIPLGYVMTNRSNYSQCKPNASYTGAGYIITSSIRSGMNICDGSPIPSGYVVTRRFNSSNCAAGTASRPAYTITDATTATTSLTICDGPYGQVVPTGFVITERNNYAQCSASAGTAPGYKIIKPSPSGTRICEAPSGESVPPNYVITERANYSLCAAGTGSGPGYYIRVPGNNETNLLVCYPSAVPAGWGFFSAQQYSICGAGTATGYGYRIGIIKEGSIVCDGSPIPATMVITAVGDTFTQCSNRIGLTLGFPKTGSLETDICYQSDSAGKFVIPQGYVIVRRKSSYPCGVAGGMTIRLPNSTGETFICADSPLPSSYVVTRSVSTTICGNVVRTAYYISLLTGNGPYQLCDGAAIPAEFVITARSTSYNQCPNGIGVTVEKPNATGLTTICAGLNSVVPTGYVVVAVKNVNQCGTTTLPSTAYDIQLPNPTGVTNICEVPDVLIPTGYVKIGAGTASCGIYPSIQIDVIGNPPPTDPPPTDPPPTGSTPITPVPYIRAVRDVTATSVPAVTYDCGSGATAASGFVSGARANSARCP